MDDHLRRGIEVIHSLSSHAGSILSDSDREFLQSQASSIDNPQQVERLSGICDKLQEGFFKAAEKGETFVDPDRVKQKFGNTLEGNYPRGQHHFPEICLQLLDVQYLERGSPITP